MIFSKSNLLAFAACTALAGCGASQDTPTAPETEIGGAAENTLKKHDFAEGSSGDTAPVEPIENRFAALPEPFANADYNRGRAVFKQCSTCHTLPQGAAHRLGPNLYGVFGREVGSAPDFTFYSKATKDADFVWTPELLGEWLENPRAFLPGNSMSFGGLRRETDRNAVIAYIMLETGYTPEAE